MATLLEERHRLHEELAQLRDEVARKQAELRRRVSRFVRDLQQNGIPDEVARELCDSILAAAVEEQD